MFLFIQSRHRSAGAFYGIQIYLFSSSMMWRWRVRPHSLKRWQSKSFVSFKWLMNVHFSSIARQESPAQAQSDWRSQNNAVAWRSSGVRIPTSCQINLSCKNSVWRFAVQLKCRPQQFQTSNRSDMDAKGRHTSCRNGVSALSAETALMMQRQ